MRVLLLMLVLLFAFPANAQQSLPEFKPPKTESGKAFSKSAKRNWQHTDAKYLHKDQPLKASTSWWNKKQPKKTDPSAPREGDRKIARFILFLLAAFIIFVIWYYSTGGKWFSFKSKNDRFSDHNSQEEGSVLFEAAAGDGMSFSDLSKINDPREGLHALLVQALLRAAKQNNIALRRSLTTRDVLRRVPPSWGHRSVLQALVNRAELVLFGGRGITPEDYANALQLARPIFGKGLGS